MITSVSLFSNAQNFYCKMYLVCFCTRLVGSVHLVDVIKNNIARLQVIIVIAPEG